MDWKFGFRNAIATVGMSAGLISGVVTHALAVPIEKLTSPSGIVAWISPDPTAKDITVMATWRDGFDPKTSKRGLGEFALVMMGSGAGGLDEVDFKSAVQDLGSTIRVFNTEGPRIGLLLTAKPDKLDETVKLAHSLFSEPRFDPIDMMRVAKTMNNGMKSFFAAPQGKAQYALWQVMRANDPATKAVLKPGEELPKFDRAELLSWHKQRFARDSMTVSLAGAITSENAGQIIDQLFAGISEKSAVPDMPMITYTGAGEVVDVPAESDQSILIVAGPFLPDAGPDEGVEGAAGDVLADYVGNGNAGRLFKKIREEKGLSYGITGNAGGGMRGTQFIISTSLPKDKAAEALALVRETLDQVAKDGISDTDLAATKERLRARHGKGLTSPTAIAGMLSSLQVKGRPIDHWDKYPDNVAQVTREQVNELARTYLKPEKMTVVIVGDATGVKITRTFPVN